MLIIAVRPSRKSSPLSVILSFFLAFIKLFLVAYTFIDLVSAERKPERWVPPSMVLILLTNVRMLSLYVLLYRRATSTGTSVFSFFTVTILLCRGLFFTSKYFTKSLKPPLNLNVSIFGSSERESLSIISSPWFKYANSLRRSAIML